MNILEAINAGRKIQTRDGQQVKIIYTNKKGDCPIVALIGDNEMLMDYPEDGVIVYKGENNLDLVIAPETKKILYVNVYLFTEFNRIHLGMDNDTLEDAISEQRMMLKNHKDVQFIERKEIEINL